MVAVSQSPRPQGKREQHMNTPSKAPNSKGQPKQPVIGNHTTPNSRPSTPKPRKKPHSDPESPSKEAAARRTPKPGKTKRDVEALASDLAKKPTKPGYSSGTGDPALDAQLARQSLSQPLQTSGHHAASFSMSTGDLTRDQRGRDQREHRDRHHASSFNVPAGFSGGTGDPALDMALAKQQPQHHQPQQSTSTPTKRSKPQSQHSQQKEQQGGKYDHFYAAGTWTNSPAPSALPIPAFKRDSGTPKPSPDDYFQSPSSSYSYETSPDMGDRRPILPRDTSGTTLDRSTLAVPERGIFSMDIAPPIPSQSQRAGESMSDAERAEKGRKLMNLLQSPASVATPAAAASRHPLVEMWEREASFSSSGASLDSSRTPGTLVSPAPPKQDSLQDATGMLKSILRIG